MTTGCVKIIEIYLDEANTSSYFAFLNEFKPYQFNKFVSFYVSILDVPAGLKL